MTAGETSDIRKAYSTQQSVQQWNRTETSQSAPNTSDTKHIHITVQVNTGVDIFWHPGVQVNVMQNDQIVKYNMHIGLNVQPQLWGSKTLFILSVYILCFICKDPGALMLSIPVHHSITSATKCLLIKAYLNKFFTLLRDVPWWGGQGAGMSLSYLMDLLPMHRTYDTTHLNWGWQAASPTKDINIHSHT